MNHHPLLSVTGRFQPFHLDHLELVRYALDHAARVVIAITNPDVRSLASSPHSTHRHLTAANPFTYYERYCLIAATLSAAAIDPTRISIVPFTLEDPLLWHSYVPTGTPQLVRVFSDWEREKVRRFQQGGYPVIVLEGEPSRRISASDIRAAMASGEPWSHWVPPGARALLTSLSCDRLLASPAIR